jgi:ABC-type nitrate/sulfonate/bicarbonate transport system substrate-binding protein
LSRIDRRRFLQLASLGAAGVLVGCGGSAASTPGASQAASAATSAAPTSRPAAAASVQPSASGRVETLDTLEPLAQRVKMKIALTPSQAQGMLPQFLALDKGWFAKAGLDVEVDRAARTGADIVPLLEHGDLDLSWMGLSPALFNQPAQGFNTKILASMSTPKEGRLSDLWLVVLKDLAGSIKTVQDLKGRTLEAATKGSSLDLLATEAVKEAGLTPGKDVTISYRAKTPADLLVLAQNKGADVLVLTEPQATEAERQNFVVRWKTYGPGSLVPWLQPRSIGTSQAFIQKNRAALVKFLEVYLLASREINKTNGAWTDDILAVVTKQSGISAETFKAMGGVTYFDPNGAINMDSYVKGQDFWAESGEVKQKSDVTKLIDLEPLNEALARVGKVSA